MVWLKNSFGVFHKILQKNPNNFFFSQPDISKCGAQTLYAFCEIILFVTHFLKIYFQYKKTKQNKPFTSRSKYLFFVQHEKPWTYRVFLRKSQTIFLINPKYQELIDRVPDELWAEVHDIVQEIGIKTSPRKRNAKKQNGCLRRSYK